MSIAPHYIPESEFPQTIAPGIHMTGNYFFNLFVIQGSEKTVLFETGVSGVVDAVIEQLQGLELSPDVLVPSHPHSDHITGLPGLREAFPHADLVAAAGAREFVAHPKAGALLIKEDQFISQELEKQGITPGRPSLDTVPDMTGCRDIIEAESWDLGGLTLELIPVGGHSPGNLMAWVPEHRVLFCSDSLGFHYPGRQIWPLFFTGAAPYLKSLETIRDLAPEILCPAHQGPISGDQVHSLIQQALDQTRAMIQRLADADPGDTQLVDALFKESYRDEFTLYTPENIQNCNRLLIRRAGEFKASGEV